MKKYTYVLKTVDKDSLAYGGFEWPKKGVVKASDWAPTETCGNGLHGYLEGEGDAQSINWANDAHWLVLRVLSSSIVNLDGKVKFPSCEVVFCGNRLGATTFLQRKCPSKAIIGAFATAGDRGTATAGKAGTATAGEAGTATAGNYGTATAGNYGTATAGDRGTATAGIEGTATAGNYGTATAGYHGTATAGYGGTATAGYGGTATAGYGGTATAGNGGRIQISWFDGQRSRVFVGYVGEGGILPNQKYSLDSKGNPVNA